ncbi:arylsulfatase [Aestuariivirga sp.]|uniref:arylsulfatase n=1 Tax=Aestuariivirga sp. TaxID=2650926 RepID=UPI003782FD8D
MLNSQRTATRTAASIFFVLATAILVPTVSRADDQKPNILFILADNLGYGELGAYGGGETRGAPTPVLDQLAREGLRLTNISMETQCTPSRSSIMTGRFAIRSGTYAVPFGGVPEGLTQWEFTIAEALSEAGYATALYGKWHLGSHDGRLPNDQGFDEWYGIPRTTDESLWSTSSGYSPDIVPLEKIMEGKKGEPSRPLEDYTVEQRRLIDAEITRRSVDFMERQVKAGKPFFTFVSLTQPHLPTEPNPSFKGVTGNGDWADMLVEMDGNVGKMLSTVDNLGVRDNTIVIFTSDNGPEFFKPWDGWAGPWRGQYFTALEGGIRVPFMVRWPAHVPAGRVSNEIVHGVDMFATLARITGAHIPSDRPMDSIDQSEFLTGKSQKSNREGFPIWGANTLLAVKWRNWKLHFYKQDTMFDPPQKLGIPFIINLYTDPREEKPTVDSWVMTPMLKIVASFQESTKGFPLIPMGTPDPYAPPSSN